MSQVSGTPNIPQPINGMIRTYEHSNRSFTRPYSAKTLFFYKEGDTRFQGIRVPVSKARYKTMDALLDDLSVKVPLPFGVRRVFTPMGRREISAIDELKHMGAYLCSSNRWARGVNLPSEKSNVSRQNKEASPAAYGKRANGSRGTNVEPLPQLRPLKATQETAVTSDSGVRMIYFVLNSAPERMYRKYFRLKYLPTLEMLLKELTDYLQVSIAKIFSQTGAKMETVDDIIASREKKFVVCQRNEKPTILATANGVNLFPSLTKEESGNKTVPRRRAHSASGGSKESKQQKVTMQSVDGLPSVLNSSMKRTGRNNSIRSNTYTLATTKSTKRRKRKKAKEAEDLLQNGMNGDLSLSGTADAKLWSKAKTKLNATALLSSPTKSQRKTKFQENQAAVESLILSANGDQLAEEEDPGDDENDEPELRMLQPTSVDQDGSSEDEIIKMEADEEESEAALPIVATESTKPTDASKQNLSKCTYTVVVLTGNRWAADLDASLYIVLHGELGKTERLWLRQDENEPKFQQNALDAFEVQDVFVGKIVNLTIGHESKGYGAGIFIDRILVSEGEVNFVQYVFMCNKWLDSGQVDGKIERTINLLGFYDLRSVQSLMQTEESHAPSPSAAINTKGKWMLTLQNASVEASGSTSKIYVTGYGSYGHSEPIPLFHEHLTQAAKSADFEIDFGEIGDLFKLRFEVDDSGVNPSWLLESVFIRNSENAEFSYLRCNKWMSSTILENGKSIEASPTKKSNKIPKQPQLFRELPFVRPGLEPLPLHQYQVRLLINRSVGAKLPGTISCQLAGEFGESGVMTAMLSETNEAYSSMHASTNKLTQSYVFSMESVSLGRLLYALFICKADIEGGAIAEGLQVLQSMYDRHNLGITAGNDWIIDSAIIREDEHAPYQFIFAEGRILPSEVPGEIRKQMKLSSMEGLSTISTKKKTKAEKEESRWKIFVTTGDHVDAGTDCIPYVTIYGNKGKSKPFPLQDAKHQLVPGSTCEYLVDTAHVGHIYKLRLRLDTESGQKPVWYLKKLKLREVHSGEELRFPVEMWLEITDDTPDATIELPAVWPDIPPPPVVAYQVVVYTGKQKDSVEQSPAKKPFDVFIQIFGQKGDTGKRYLRKSDNATNIFTTNSVNKFDIECVSVEEITKILVGQNSSSSQVSWRLEKIEIHEPNSSLLYTFDVKRNLSNTNGKKAQIEVTPSSKIHI